MCTVTTVHLLSHARTGAYIHTYTQHTYTNTHANKVSLKSHAEGETGRKTRLALLGPMVV